MNTALSYAGICASKQYHLPERGSKGVRGLGVRARARWEQKSPGERVRAEQSEAPVAGASQAVPTHHQETLTVLDLIVAQVQEAQS